VYRDEETGAEVITDVKTPSDPPEHRVFAPSSLLYGTQVSLSLTLQSPLFISRPLLLSSVVDVLPVHSSASYTDSAIG
jgi:hypothetical protein